MKYFRRVYPVEYEFHSKGIPAKKSLTGETRTHNLPRKLSAVVRGAPVGLMAHRPSTRCVLRVAQAT